MLEFYYNFLDKFCGVDNFEEIEIDTDSLYLNFDHKILYDGVQKAKNQEWHLLSRHTKAFIEPFLKILLCLYLCFFFIPYFQAFIVFLSMS